MERCLSLIHIYFVSPEQIIPQEGIRDVNGKPLIWEACFTMNDSWGYRMTDKLFKPAPMPVSYTHLDVYKRQDRR